MKILSFDVGLRHLAYCIIEFNDAIFIDRKKRNIERLPLMNYLKIHSWGIINVLEDDDQSTQPIPVCSSDGCSAKAKVKFAIDSGETFACGRHKKKLSKDHIEISLPPPPKRRNALKLSLEEQSIYLTQALSPERAPPELFQVQRVIIEQQPRLNMKMKLVSAMVLQIFIWNKLETELFSAAHKLRVLSDVERIERIRANAQNLSRANFRRAQYRMNKQDSEKHTRILLNYLEPQWTTLFNTSRKKDDLADSLLQGIAYIKKICLWKHDVI